MNLFKPLRQGGFGHVELVVAVLVVSLFGFVGYRVVASHAATVPFLSQSQCTLMGRTWNGSRTANPCNDSCATGQGSLISTPTYDFCSNAVTKASSISAASCAAYGRLKLASATYYVGCARRADQKTVAKAPQCANATYTYRVESPYDKCVAPAVATPAPAPKPAPTPTPAPKPAPSPSPNPTPVKTNQTNATVSAGLACSLRGRTTSGSTCTTTCQSGAGSLVTSGTYAYCSWAVSRGINAATCADLHRVWLTDGCARLYTQKTTANASQCSPSSYTYNVTSTNDVCLPAGSTSVAAAEKSCLADRESMRWVNGACVPVPTSASPPATPPVKTITVTNQSAYHNCVNNTQAHQPNVKCVLGGSPTKPHSGTMTKTITSNSWDQYNQCVFLSKVNGNDISCKLVLTPPKKQSIPQKVLHAVGAPIRLVNKWGHSLF